MLNNKIDFATLSKVEKEFGNFEIGQVYGGGNPNSDIGIELMLVN